MRKVEKWRAFWSDQDSPLHRRDSPEFHRALAKELRILFGDNSPKRVLEIGCANGAVFEFLGFEPLKYRGIDFSARLLAQFKFKYPTVELECLEASSYIDHQNKYDLIFSNE